MPQMCGALKKERPNVQWARTTRLLAHKHIHLSILICRDSCETARKCVHTLAVSPRVCWSLASDGSALWLWSLLWMFGGLWTLPPGFSTLISSCKCSFLATDREQWVGCGIVNVMLRGCLEMAVSSTQLYITVMEQWGEPWGCQCAQ